METQTARSPESTSCRIIKKEMSGLSHLFFDGLPHFNGRQFYSGENRVNPLQIIYLK